MDNLYPPSDNPTEGMPPTRITETATEISQPPPPQLAETGIPPLVEVGGLLMLGGALLAGLAIWLERRLGKR
jgi:hypothetical protein